MTVAAFLMCCDSEYHTEGPITAQINTRTVTQSLNRSKQGQLHNHCTDQNKDSYTITEQIKTKTVTQSLHRSNQGQLHNY